MPGEVQAVRAAPRWPAGGERFLAGWDDVAAAAALLDALAGGPAEGAVERALADVLERAACEGPASLVLAVADDDATGTTPFRVRCARAVGGVECAIPDLDIPPDGDVVAAVTAALGDAVAGRAAVGCPLVGPDGRPRAWLVASGAEPCAARLRAILETTAWVFSLALRRGWDAWRTQPDWPGLGPDEEALCRAAREAVEAAPPALLEKRDYAEAEEETRRKAAEQAVRRAVDDNVQFTVYRPRRIAPETWRPVLAFAHLAERRPDAPADAPDPIEEVRRQARQVLGDAADAYTDVTQDSGEAIPREGEFTFVLDLPGMLVNPPQRSFRWVEDVQREEFRVKAPAALDGQTVRGALRVHLGALLVAEVRLAIAVDGAAGRTTPAETDAEHARPYRRIFPSYSHRDEEIVRQVEAYARTMGDKYLRDVTHLRAGERWNDSLLEFIRTADVFQLFWSRDSMRSPWVRQEWEYALSLDRPHFVRPTYWQTPLPEAPDQDLPPAALRALHFQHLPVREVPVGEPPRPAPTAPAPSIPPVTEPAAPADAERGAATVIRLPEAVPGPRRVRRRRVPTALAALLLVGFVGGSLIWRTQGPSPPSLPMAGDTGQLRASSADGTLLAAMDDAGVLRIESQPAGGAPVVIATAFRPADVVAMRFSDDGTRLLCQLRTGETVAWDVRTGARVAMG